MRLSHWGMALSVLALMATGWLLQFTTGVAQAAIDFHYMAGAILAMALILRFGLLFRDKGAGQWRSLIPSTSQLSAIRDMLRFYLSFGKAPLPGWYAHNPLWIPLYLAVLVILAIQSLTGFFMDGQPVIAGFYLPEIHDICASIIWGFVILHLIAVFLHDLKGTGSDVSAMINGHRIFIIRPLQDQTMETGHSVPLESILKNRKPPE